MDYRITIKFTEGIAWEAVVAEASVGPAVTEALNMHAYEVTVVPTDRVAPERPQAVTQRDIGGSNQATAGKSERRGAPGCDACGAKGWRHMKGCKFEGAGSKKKAK